MFVFFTFIIGVLAFLVSFKKVFKILYFINGGLIIILSFLEQTDLTITIAVVLGNFPHILLRLFEKKILE